MNKLGQVLKNAASTLRIWASSSSTWSWFNWLAGTEVDYLEKAGRVYDNSAVLAPLLWIWRNLQYCRLVVQEPKPGKNGVAVWTEVIGHPLPVAIENGVFVDDSVLWHGTILSWFIDGNAYWYKVRS